MTCTRLSPVVLVLMLAAAASTIPHSVRADAKQIESFGVWHQMQLCAKEATKQFPDHTPDGNAKREAARQQCLRARHLPVTEAVPTPQR